MEKTSEKTIVIARLGVMAALSVVLAALFHFPLFPAASFLEYDPADIPILLVALNIWKFTVHVLLKSGFENFEHYFTSM